MRRVFLFVVAPLAVLFIVAVLWFGWTGWQVQGDLTAAQREAARVQVALSDGDPDGVREAGAALEASSARAMDLTDGWDWAALTVVPVIGDDADGIRALSASLHTLSSDGLEPLLGVTGDIDRLAVDGGVDLEVVESMQAPVADGYAAIREAAEEVRAVESDGFVGRLRTPFEEYVEVIDGLESGLGAAATATALLPTMAGGEEPREYLLLVQNNAEIRASGGLPGAFVLLGADEGRLEILRQGGPRDFESDLPEPILPLADAEEAVFGEQLGTYVQDANFTPDFPRTAELVDAHWEASGARADLDGVLSVDPVALSYVLGAIGSVEVDGRMLTQDNLLSELLNEPYLQLEPEAQDQLFEDAARTIFEEAVSGSGDTLGFMRGLARAGGEGRLLIHSFAEDEQARLAGTRVAGELAGDDGRIPHVDVALNDATGSKMSYYLRYGVEVVSEGCRPDGQRLAGSMRLRSTVESAAAADLPVSVTGGGNFGTERGSQLVLVRIFGPYGGSIERLRLDRELVPVRSVILDGRPVVTATVLLSSTEPIDVDWRMSTPPGQTGDVEVGVTPSIVPGDKSTSATTTC